jgi:signal peptidase I
VLRRNKIASSHENPPPSCRPLEFLSYADKLRLGESAINHICPLTIPPAMYLFMGDNRDNSRDGREWGLVPRSHIAGKALYVWISIENLEDEGKEAVLRWERMPLEVK